MTVNDIKSLLVGIIKQSFPNRKTLRSLTENEEGKLLFNGETIATDIKISEEENNALQNKDTGLFVEDKQEQIDELKTKLDPITKYQKYINTDLDYCGAYIEQTETLSYKSSTCPFVLTFDNIDTNMEYDKATGYFTLKANKKYEILFCPRIGTNIKVNNEYPPLQVTFVLKDDKDNTISGGHSITPINLNNWSGKNILKIVQFDEDTKIKIIVNNISNDKATLSSIQASLTIKEINRQIVIDPIEHINDTKGIEDTPVGHIIAHMGNTAPKHYLICDGAEYNIEDYPYLAEHIKDNFGSYNFFGGDGEVTFAVPDLRERFLKGSNNAGVNQVAGLPNITGSGPSTFFWGGRTEFINGAIITNTIVNDAYITQDGNDTGTTNRYRNRNFTFNASKSNAIYGKSSTVTPLNTSVLYCIKYEPTYYTNTYNTNYIQRNVYSLEEQVVGSWIDGKPLYQKTIKLDSQLSLPTNEWVDTKIDGADIGNIIDCKIYNGPTFSGHALATAYNTANNVIKILSTRQSTNNITAFTIQYTKTSDAENSYDDSVMKESYVEITHTEEELKQTITDILAELDKELEEEEPAVVDTPTVIPELYPEMEDTPTVIPEIYDEPEVPEEEQVEAPVEQEEEITEPEEPQDEPDIEPEEGDVEQ